MMVTTRTTDWYDVFGVPRTATSGQIKSAYRLLAKLYHPDTSTQPDAEERFKELQAAYDVLSDRARREVYDQQPAPAPRMDQTVRRLTSLMD
jgi:molecular chaperone DnaJ